MNTAKHTLTFFLSAMLTLSAWAVPAYRGWRTMTQPDGSTITIRQMGDEFFHYWENEEGQQVAKDEQGFWRVKETPAVPDEEMRKKQASRQYNQHVSKPRKAAGAINLAPRGLVILVNYTDVTYRSENTQSAMSDLMNSENYTYNSATGSVREFFKVQSNGAYVPDFDVAGPYTLAHNRAYYGANDAKGNDVLPGDMIVEACKLADADGVDFTKYNNDGDNYVDFVYVIYAGEGAADSDEADAIWPHNWTLSSARYYNNCTYSASQSRVDGLYINNYACSGELKGRSTTRCPIGTITHEFGHVLGLPDYYVTDDEASNAGMKYTPGAWHIMDYGSYNNDGRTPPNYSPHDKYYFGWSTPTLLAKDAQKNCTLTTTYGSAYQITGGSTLKGATASDRIWYLENRQKSGWDKYLPGHGLVVWEVTYNSDDWENNEPNNENIGYTIVTANSLSRPYKPCVYSTTASSTSGTTFPGTSNKTSYTPATGCDLTEITESGGNITFKYNGGVVKTRATYEFETDHCTAPANGDVAINDPLSVTITPNSGYTLDDASCWMVEMGGVLLTYGTGFTYNASTNTFHIASLTDDVVILAEAKVVRTVTWSINGSTSTIPASTFADGAALVLPSAPSDCSGDGGKKFVGWTASSSVSGSAPTDLFTEAGTKTVTANITYYAVYASGSGSGGGSGNYELVEAAPSNWAGDYLIAYNSETFADGRTGGTSGIGAQNVSVAPGTNLSGKVVAASWGDSYKVTIEASETSGKYLLKTQDGLYNYQTSNANGIATSSNKSTAESNSLSIAFNSSSDIAITVNSTAFHYNTQGYFRFYKNAGQSAIYLYKKASGAGTSYSDCSLTCGTPCSNTPTMSFSEPTTVAKTTADVSFTKAVTITGKGSGQTVAYSSSDETVATVNSSGVVTLQGKVGSTTITASVEANGTYCAASASYTLNVSAAPINVTLYYNGTSASLTNQTNPYTLPTGSPYNTAMCSGDWTFAGWYGSAYTKSTDAPAYITQLTATGSAYAVYTTTESSGSGGTGGSVSITTSTDNIPTGYGSANTFTEYTFEGYKFKVQQMYLNSGKLQWRAAGNSSGTGTMYNNETFPGKITSIVLTYNSSDANKNFTVKVGDSANPSSGTDITPSISGSVYTFDCSSENADYFVLTNGSGAGYLNQIDINYGGGGSSTTYYATSPDCVTPCSITPTMSFTDETVNRTTSDASYTQTVTIDNKGSGQTVTYSSSDETVATVSNSGVVTLKGKVGSTTITASVAADGDYCAASASYTINVTAAPIDVTLYYNGTSASLTDQANPYTLPTGAPYNTAMCDGNWTFDGWYGSTYAKSTDKPTYITELEATGSAHAVYKTTETSGGGSGSTVTFNFGYSADWGQSSSWSGTDKSSVTATKSGVTVTHTRGTGSMYANATATRFYKDNTLTFSVETGSITSIVFTCSTYQTDITSDVGTCTASSSEFSWSGDASSVSFSRPSGASSYAQFSAATITISGGGSSTTYYATSPDCTPTTTYTVTWISCGEPFDSKTYSEGEALVLPSSTPSANAGKSFVGWTATQHHTGASAPADLFNTAGSKTVTADVTYYAVFH